MSDEPVSGSPDQGGSHPPSENHRAPRNLPPPAFPPGARGRHVTRTPPAVGDDDEDTSDLPEDAFISPDDPLPGSDLDDALISPDAPIIRTRPPEKPEDYESVLSSQAAVKLAEDDADEVVVTGIGSDAHLGEEDFPDEVPKDPYVEKLLESLSVLTAGIRQRGEAGLRATSEMSRFEVTLRAYCVGYLAGMREDRD